MFNGAGNENANANGEPSILVGISLTPTTLSKKLRYINLLCYEHTVKCSFLIFLVVFKVKKNI